MRGTKTSWGLFPLELVLVPVARSFASLAPTISKEPHNEIKMLQTRDGVLLSAVLHRADESQPARNSCPRLPHSVDSRFGLSCRCRVKFSTQSDQPCRNSRVEPGTG